jgi:acyl carrier protein
MNSGILQDVRRIVADVLHLDPATVSAASSRDTISKWDSMGHVNVVLALEQHFDLQFLPEEMMQMLNVELIGLLIEEKLALSGRARV